MTLMKAAQKLMSALMMLTSTYIIIIKYFHWLSLYINIIKLEMMYKQAQLKLNNKAYLILF